MAGNAITWRSFGGKTPFRERDLRIQKLCRLSGCPARRERLYTPGRNGRSRKIWDASARLARVSRFMAGECFLLCRSITYVVSLQVPTYSYVFTYPCIEPHTLFRHVFFHLFDTTSNIMQDAHTSSCAYAHMRMMIS